MTERVFLGSTYLGPVEYYTKLYAYGEVWLERYDHYIKQTYRNRCVIESAGGPLVLTVPTEKEDGLKCLMKDVRISDHGNWRHMHWNAFVASYRHSPFFDYYADEFQRFFTRKFDFLFDFNLELCQWVCEQIDIHPEIRLTDDYVKIPDDADDYRDLIHPKRDYRDCGRNFIPEPYYQVFTGKNGFLPNLSVADLLFNMGPESILVLRDSIAKNRLDHLR